MDDDGTNRQFTFEEVLWILFGSSFWQPAGMFFAALVAFLLPGYLLFELDRFGFAWVESYGVIGFCIWFCLVIIIRAYWLLGWYFTSGESPSPPSIQELLKDARLRKAAIVFATIVAVITIRLSCVIYTESYDSLESSLDESGPIRVVEDAKNRYHYVVGQGIKRRFDSKKEAEEFAGIVIISTQTSQPSP